MPTSSTKPDDRQDLIELIHVKQAEIAKLMAEVDLLIEQYTRAVAVGEA